MVLSTLPQGRCSCAVEERNAESMSEMLQRSPFSMWAKSCWQRKRSNSSPDTCVASVTSQCGDEVALITRFCVQLLLQT